MKICKICLKSDMLCGACHAALESGKISQSYVNLARAIFKIRPDSQFTRFVETDKFIIVIADKDNARKIIGKAGRNVKKLTQTLGKQLKVVEMSQENEMLEELLSVPVIAINKIYGSIEGYKIRIPKRFRAKVRFSPEVASQVMQKNVEFVFE